LNTTATRVSAGATSLSVCSHLPPIPNSKLVEAGDIAAGSCQLGHEAAADRIGHLHEHHRQFGTLLAQRRQHRRAVGEDQLG
jgi:hypothetical protein